MRKSPVLTVRLNFDDEALHIRLQPLGRLGSPVHRGERFAKNFLAKRTRICGNLSRLNASKRAVITGFLLFGAHRWGTS